MDEDSTSLRGHTGHLPVHLSHATSSGVRRASSPEEVGKGGDHDVCPALGIGAGNKHLGEDCQLPIRPLSGLRQLKVSLPGSKSITNRALLLAVLRPGATTLKGALFSDDTRVMLECLKSLGFEIFANEAEKAITVQGRGGEIPNARAELFVGNAGTAARFLSALLALRKGGEYSLDGSAAMRKRPMKGLLEALQKLGCEFAWKGEEWHFPFAVKTHGIEADSVSVDASASSQILSALLMIAPCIAKAGKTFSVALRGETVSRPFVEMTLQMIRTFGGAWFPVAEATDNHASLPPSPPLSKGRGESLLDEEFRSLLATAKAGDNRQSFIPCQNPQGRGEKGRGEEFVCGGGYLTKSEPLVYEIEPDATAASYFAILPFVHAGSMVDIPGFVVQGGLQGDSEFVFELATPPHNLLSIEEIDGGVRISKGPSSAGFEMDFNDISDTFLTLAAVAPLLESALTITGIEHTRKQETDRVAAVVAELAKIVGEENVSQTDDSLIVSPCGLEAIRARADACPDGVISIETYDDHRMAMSFAVLGTYDLRGDGSAWLSIRNPACCQKTFPNFFSELLGHS